MQILNDSTRLCVDMCVISTLYTVCFTLVLELFYKNYLPGSRAFRIGMYVWFALATAASISWITTIAMSADWRILFRIRRRGAFILIFVFSPSLLYYIIYDIRRLQRLSRDGFHLSDELMP